MFPHRQPTSSWNKVRGAEGITSFSTTSMRIREIAYAFGAEKYKNNALQYFISLGFIIQKDGKEKRIKLEGQFS